MATSASGSTGRVSATAALTATTPRSVGGGARKANLRARRSGGKRTRRTARLAEALRSLTAGRLKRLMGRLGIEFVTGLEKSEYVEQIAKHEEADEALREDEA